MKYDEDLDDLDLDEYDDTVSFRMVNSNYTVGFYGKHHQAEKLPQKIKYNGMLFGFDGTYKTIWN